MKHPLHHRLAVGTQLFARISLLVCCLATAAAADAPPNDPVRLAVLPAKPYAANDGIRPQWRFMLIAVNQGTDTLTLHAMTTVLGGANQASPVSRRAEFPEIIQGTPTVKKGEKVVFNLEDDGRSRSLPDAVTVELVFLDSQKRETRVTSHVTLKALPTVYLRFPLAGKWCAINARKDRHCIGGAFGFDFVAQEDVAMHGNPPARPLMLGDFRSYGRPVYAPLDGHIVACVHGRKDFPPTPGVTSFRKRPPEDRSELVGNYLIIAAPPNRHVFMAHLMQNSLTVKPGDRIQEGQLLARVGNSGNSSGPHLHIEVLDEVPNLAALATMRLTQADIPFGFRKVVRRRAGEELQLEAIVPEKMGILWNAAENPGRQE